MVGGFVVERASVQRATEDRMSTRFAQVKRAPSTGLGIRVVTLLLGATMGCANPTAAARISPATQGERTAADPDGDGIPTGEDKCPHDAEWCNGQADSDGCPEAFTESFRSDKELCSPSGNSMCRLGGRVCSGTSPEWLKTAPGHCIVQPSVCTCRQTPPWGCAEHKAPDQNASSPCTLDDRVCVVVFPKFLLAEGSEAHWMHVLSDAGLEFAAEGATARVTETPGRLGAIADNIGGSLENGECELHVEGLRVVEGFTGVVAGFGACP